MKEKIYGSRLLSATLVSSLALACSAELESGVEDDGERLVGDDGRIDWRTIVDNAERNNGFRFNGFRFNGFRFNGFRFNGFRFNGFRFNGESLTSLHMENHELTGVDSLANVLAGVSLDGGVFDVDFVDPGDPGNTTTLEFKLTDTEVLANGLVVSTILHRELPSGSWTNACDNGAKAVHLKGDWDLLTGEPLSSDPSLITFACLGAALGDCAVWGYVPGELHNGTSLNDYHEACTRLKRADYCGDGVHHTQNGHIIDVYDDLGIQSPVTVGVWDVEAMWGPDGAICSNTTRILDFTKNGLSQSKEYIGCEIPACEDLNQDGVIDFIDYPTAVLADRTVPGWLTRDFAVYSVYNKSQGLFFTKSTDGGNTFSERVEVTAVPSVREIEPKIVVDSAENIHIIFAPESPTGTLHSEVRYARSSDGGQTFDDQLLSTTGAGNLENGDEPVVRQGLTLDSSDNLHGFYDQEVAGVKRLHYTASSDAGATWSTPVILDSAANEAKFTKAVAGSDGSVHLVYLEQDASAQWSAFYQKLGSFGAGWSTPVKISSNESLDLDMILDGGNNPHFAYQEVDPQPGSLLFYRRSSDGGNSLDAPSALIDSAYKGPIRSIRLKLDSNGYPQIVYKRLRYGDELLFYAKSSDGSTFDPAVSVDPDRTTNYNLYDLHFFISSEDTPMIIWRDKKNPDANQAVYMTISVDSGLSFIDPIRVTPSGPAWDSVYSMAVTQDPDGNPYFMYSHNNIDDGKTSMHFMNSALFGDDLGDEMRMTTDNWDDYPVVIVK